MDEDHHLARSISVESTTKAFVVVEPPRPWFIHAAAVITLVSGLMCNLAVKLQNRTSHYVCSDHSSLNCAPEYFDQPYWQTFIMFSGESLCLLVWWFEVWKRDRKGRHLMKLEFPNTIESFNKPRTPIWWWIFPALIDLIGTAFVNMAFTMSYVSTVQMLRNTVLIVTTLFTLIMIHRPLRVHELGGLSLMISGMLLAGVQAIRSPETSTNIDESKAWIGIVLTMIGTIFNAFQFILEEWYFRKAYMPPMACMGLQGIFGVGLNIIALIIAHYSKISNFQHGWYQMNNSAPIIAGNLWYFFFVFIFNGASICVTKLGSGLLRAVVYSMRAPILWLIELILGWQGFSVSQLIALILALVGFFIYAFVIPWVSLTATPKTYRFFRLQIPCFCTDHSPPTESDDATKDIISKSEPTE